MFQYHMNKKKCFERDGMRENFAFPVLHFDMTPTSLLSCCHHTTLYLTKGSKEREKKNVDVTGLNTFFHRHLIEARREVSLALSLARMLVFVT